MLEIKRYTFSELNQMRVSKGELFAELKKEGIEFDYAIPEDWADSFYAFCQKYNPLITYHLIVSTTVWTYGTIFGNPLSCCVEVHQMLEKYYA
jgi:hypothetical protein